MAKIMVALALRDIPQFGIAGGQLVQADDAQIKTLADDGSVDAHKDAVAAARGRGEVPVKLPALPDPARQAELDAAHARLHHLQGLAQASNPAEREALQPQIDAAQAAIQALGPA